MALEITDSNIKNYLEEGKPLVIDFWAEWCGPCRMISPIVDELFQAYGDKVNIGKVNVDENDEISAEYGIRSIPTLLFFKNGELVDKHVGAATKAVLEEKVKALL
ncbi:thioredoxin [Bacteroidales bacterium OttesenSCG-928-A17]|nr:thioredoxin [Bacteroidales bacterium OttesenSCG-928-A17]